MGIGEIFKQRYLPGPFTAVWNFPHFRKIPTYGCSSGAGRREKSPQDTIGKTYKGFKHSFLYLKLNEKLLLDIYSKVKTPGTYWANHDLIRSQNPMYFLSEPMMTWALVETPCIFWASEDLSRSRDPMYFLSQWWLEQKSRPHVHPWLMIIWIEIQTPCTSCFDHPTHLPADPLKVPALHQYYFPNILGQTRLNLR